MGAPVIPHRSSQDTLFNWLVPFMGYDASSDMWRPVAVSAGGGVATAIDQTTPGTTNGVQLTGTKRTPTCSAVTSNGSTTDGVKAVTIVSSSDFAGTVLGQTLAVSSSLSFAAPPGDVLGSFAYTRSAGTLYLYYIP